jgi:hypothetical protein
MKRVHCVGLIPLTPIIDRSPKKKPWLRFHDWRGVPEKNLEVNLPTHTSEEALSHGRAKGHAKNSGHPLTRLPVRTIRKVPSLPALFSFSAGLKQRSREGCTLPDVGHEGIVAETAGDGDRVPDVLHKEIAKVLIE